MWIKINRHVGIKVLPNAFSSDVWHIVSRVWAASLGDRGTDSLRTRHTHPRVNKCEPQTPHPTRTRCQTHASPVKQQKYYFPPPLLVQISSEVKGVIYNDLGGGPRVVVSTAAFHTRVRGSVPGLGGLKETKMFLPHPRVKVSIVGSLRDREVACSASDRQGSNFESCVWRTVSSQSSHHPQEVLLAQFSLYVHKGGLKPDSFHFIYIMIWNGFLIQYGRCRSAPNEISKI